MVLIALGPTTRLLVGITLSILTLNKFYLSQAVEVQIVEDVMNKLDRFAARKSNSSELTMAELEDATEQFLSWDDRTRKSFKRRYHQIRLLEDFLFIPITRFNDLIGEAKQKTEGTGKEDEEMRQDFIRLVELFYRKFKPAYQGKMIGYQYANGKKINILLASILDIEGNAHYKPMSAKILLDAHKEYKAYLKRIEDIALHEDIFACAEELKLELNYINRGEVKLLAEKVFPLVESEPEKLEEKLNDIKELYQIEFSKQKDYKIKDNQIVRIRSARQ